ncbi:branched-chain amino acid transport system permease protein [Desulfotomaculum arcticum]|uniref:Branched-chain amino acid transport system permease protein n=1 Tax=Desulfotruncus arcticus DSM 17038 TaxID=1121424 RepID=A0A1I2S565_9FIRM|nr:branched-chain amino acid ABC transporter permease [Desulfotruncus arcticus]SFG45186.1 branched-chain amino acid transport system permease protein [Desulfotomaculum arcticum] [Desulfotruncus arcticus DSM 17038]
MAFLDGLLPAYYESIIITVGIYIILALGLNLITGVTGQLSLGHAAYLCIGAYTSAIVTMKFGLPFIVALLCAGVVSALFGVLIGFPVLRLTGDYLAICTLGFGEILKSVLFNMPYVGGAMGMAGIPPKTTLLNTVIIALLVIIVMIRMERSRFGRSLVAIREDEIASECMGIDAFKYKLQMFAIGTFTAGLGGALWAHKIMVLQPRDFGFMKSIEILNMVVLGGLGSIPGTILGATLLTAIPEILRFSSEYRMIIYGALLVIMMIFRPHGLMGNMNFNTLVKRTFKRFNAGADKEQKNKKSGMEG